MIFEAILRAGLLPFRDHCYLSAGMSPTKCRELRKSGCRCEAYNAGPPAPRKIERRFARAHRQDRARRITFIQGWQP